MEFESCIITDRPSPSAGIFTKGSDYHDTIFPAVLLEQPRDRANRGWDVAR